MQIYLCPLGVFALPVYLGCSGSNEFDPTAAISVLKSYFKNLWGRLQSPPQGLP
jgi:hypothetical protein